MSLFHLITSLMLLLLFEFLLLLMAYTVHQSITTKIPEMIIKNMSRKVALTVSERKFSLLNKKDE